MVKLNSELVKSPSYRDFAVASGKTYTYSVSAVDVRGNESQHSERNQRACSLSNEPRSKGHPYEFVIHRKATALQIDCHPAIPSLVIRSKAGFFWIFLS